MRELTWKDLRMRLEAARDLRNSLVRDDSGGKASFDSLSARRIASQPDGKESGNLTDLANGKGSSRNEGFTPDVAAGSAPRN
ncbi:hypothetical protein [Alteraurantiacibacter aquimixticola]|uniref:Uncharacterized protein n=1 Tax=Alteraurantiacibacter aquimixticola TaxID=2489173 RepID=A0A4T3EYN3_9SPHN|nr:hypothetical protein [Alteraurantiacibacter aquimixticola]TIX49201.1 hypothetical protein E5222_15930 [Alteraurantiacibacter aquimixticola]